MKEFRYFIQLFGLYLPPIAMFLVFVYPKTLTVDSATFSILISIILYGFWRKFSFKFGLTASFVEEASKIRQFQKQGKILDFSERLKIFWRQAPFVLYYAFWGTAGICSTISKYHFLFSVSSILGIIMISYLIIDIAVYCVSRKRI